MGLIDYTGKLNTHEDYLKVIEKLEKVCQYMKRSVNIFSAMKRSKR